MAPDEFLQRFAGSPDWYVHHVDLGADAALVVSLGRENYRAASFLDDRALTPGLQGTWIPLAQLSAAVSTLGDPRPLHFIWHTGHVGSTLLSRLLDEVPGVLSLREPLPLRTLADASDTLGGAHSLVSRERFDGLLGALSFSWARGYADTRAVVVKAASVTARVAPLLLARIPAARSVYLNLRLEPYLAGSLGRGPIDLRNYGPERIRRLQSRITTPLEPLWSLSAGELGALSWLTETLTERDLAAQFGERVLCLDFDAVLADVDGTTRRVLEHLALSPGDGYSDRVETVLGRHSKAPGQPYSPERRRAALEESRKRHGEEIRKGMAWVERLARSEPSVGELPCA